jgi:HD superfamily phosphohydrolase YqeK
MTTALLSKYTMTLECNDLKSNIQKYFEVFNRHETYEHTLDVLVELKKLQSHIEFDWRTCETAVLMHDLGRVVEKEDLVTLCEEQGHSFKTGERDLPSILHQIASRIIAEHVFGIENLEVLNALECHTTLKASPSVTDKAVFLADKLSWKETAYQGMVTALNRKLEKSYDEAIFHYLSDLHNKRDVLKCYHIWSKEAYQFMA